MKKHTLTILAGSALCLMLGSSCDDPMSVTTVDPPSGEASIILIPGDLDPSMPKGPPAPEGPVAAAGPAALPDFMEAEAEEAIRQLEQELDALQITPAVVWAEQAAVREQATQVSLMISVLVRGERVSVLGATAAADAADAENGYVHVRMRNGATGYVKQQELLLGDIEQLYCFDNSPFFEKPDSTTKPQDWLRIGTPAFMITSKGAWIEVMLGDGRRGWMLSSDLAEDTAVLDMGGS